MTYRDLPKWRAFCAFAFLFLCGVLAFAPGTSWPAVLRTPVTLRVVLKKGSTVSNVCADVSRLRQLPGSMRDCWRNTLSRNGIHNARRVPAGTVLLVAVVPLSTEKIAPVQKKASPPPSALALPVRTIAARQKQAVVYHAPVIAYVFIGGFILLPLVLGAALILLLLRYRQMKKEMDGMIGRQELQKEMMQTLRQELDVAQREVATLSKGLPGEQLLAEIAVIIAAEYVEGHISAAKRTSFVRITGISREGGTYDDLFCELPWGGRMVYDHRDVERAFYEHSKELSESLGITVKFPPRKHRRFDQLFEEQLPSKDELVARQKEAA